MLSDLLRDAKLSWCQRNWRGNSLSCYRVAEEHLGCNGFRVSSSIGVVTNASELGIEYLRLSHETITSRATGIYYEGTLEATLRYRGCKST